MRLRCRIFSGTCTRAHIWGYAVVSFLALAHTQTQTHIHTHTHTHTWCYTVGSSRALAHAWCYSVGSSLAPAHTHTHTWCTHTWWRFWDCVYQREREERNVCRSGKKIFIRVLSRRVTFVESMSIFRSRCEPLGTRACQESSYRELVRRSLSEILPRDLIWGACPEILPRGLLHRSCQKSKEKRVCTEIL